jgi:hypothetical protein
MHSVQCRDLYFSIKEAMEKAASRMKGALPGTTSEFSTCGASISFVRRSRARWRVSHSRRQHGRRRNLTSVSRRHLSHLRERQSNYASVASPRHVHARLSSRNSSNCKRSASARRKKATFSFWKNSVRRVLCSHARVLYFIPSRSEYKANTDSKV